MSVKVRIQNETPKLKAAAKKATITSLGHAAGYTRRIAVNSIRRTKKPSAPGSPPHSPTGVLKRGIAFAVEEGRQAAVIGPTRSALGLIGATHEFGGPEPPKPVTKGGHRFDLVTGGHGPIRNLSSPPGTWKKNDVLIVVRLSTDRMVERARQVAAPIPPSMGGPASKNRRVYPPRPFMGPALRKAAPRLPTFWANSIRAA